MSSIALDDQTKPLNCFYNSIASLYYHRTCELWVLGEEKRKTDEDLLAGNSKDAVLEKPMRKLLFE